MQNLRNFFASLLIGAFFLSTPIVIPSQEPNVVTLIQPNRGEILYAGKVFEIQWTTSGTGGNINLQFSLDSGKTWTDIVYFPNPAKEPGGLGAFVWLVPPVSSDHSRIRVIWSPPLGPSVWDISDLDFSIRKVEAIFPDVPFEYWAFQEINSLNEVGILSGYPDGYFKPENPVSRAEFAKIALLAFRLPPSKPEFSTFSDVPPDHWAYQFIEGAVKAGLIKGYPDGTFQPEKEVSKAEAITILVRFLAWPLVSPPRQTFFDCSPGDWFYSFVETALGGGLLPLDVPQIVRKDDSGNFLFDPSLPATRSQASYLIYQAGKASLLKL
ncbi:MAG: S-layer homology domain-containing protein [Caldiserica bacterium]|nr:S-layer homology domain-containing protein [Caldisericota bacterium]